MRAFIYAAGRAIRLGPEYARRPKILIELGGRSLLEWHVMRLREVGITELTIITGHEREQVAVELPRLSQAHGLRICEIYNANFTEGSVLSFEVSLASVLAGNDTVLLMDGDVLYPAEMLRRLMVSRHPSALLVDQNYSTADDDPVLVPMRKGRPFEFVKRWTGEAEQIGESIGFFKVSPEALQIIASETRRRTVGEGRLDSYDEVLRVLAKGDCFGAEDVTGLPWTEVDFPKDVEYARNEILPALAGASMSGL